jgi:hypothetical protein
MLVKLGNSWFDPIKVVSIENTGAVTTTEGMIRVDGNPDDLASTVNNALSIQTFGGGEDETAKEKASA